MTALVGEWGFQNLLFWSSGSCFPSQVSERIEENMDRLRVSMSIWDDVLSSKDEIEGWSNSSLPQLAENISDLNSSLKTEEFLKEFEVTDSTYMQSRGTWLYKIREKKKGISKSILLFKDTEEYDKSHLLMILKFD